jgi:hypothetical protein
MCRAGGSTFLDFWYLGGSQKLSKKVFGWVAFSQIWYLGGSLFYKFTIYVKGSNMLRETCVNNVITYIGGWCCLHILNTGCVCTIHLN